MINNNSILQIMIDCYTQSNELSYVIRSYFVEFDSRHLRMLLGGFLAATKSTGLHHSFADLRSGELSFTHSVPIIFETGFETA